VREAPSLGCRSLESGSCGRGGERAGNEARGGASAGECWWAPGDASRAQSSEGSRVRAGCYFFTWPRNRASFEWGAFWPGTDVGDSIRVWIVDVRGKRLVFEALTKPGHGIEQEIGDIIRSIRFG
jgi:hypothetical protein